MRRAARLAVALLLIPVIASVFPGCAELFLLHPSRHRIDGAATRMFGSLELALVARGGAPDADGPARPSALVFIGNASRAEYAAPRWADVLAGLVGDVAALNYPGYGRSAGRADLDAMVPAALDARRALDAPVLIGNSMGGAVALAAAAREPWVRLMILQNVPPLRPLILKRHGWWNLWLLALPVALQVPAELDAIDNARRCAEVPAVFLVSLHDRTVPATYQQDVIDAYAGPKVVIRYDGGHNAGVPAHVRDELRRAALELLGG